MQPAAQIAMKQQVLSDNFQRIGKVEPAQWLPPLTDEAWGYRRKGRFSVRHVAKKERVLVGFREESNPRFVADIQRCEVIHPALGPKVGLLAELVSGMDAARHIAQIEFAAGDADVALVFRHLSPLSDRDRDALVAFGKEHGFAIYLQPSGVSSVHALWPEGHQLSFGIPGQDVDMAFLPLDQLATTGSVPVRNTIGTFGLAVLTARMGPVPPPTARTATRWLPRSAASAGRRS